MELLKKLSLLLALSLPAFAAPTAVAWSTPTAPYWTTNGFPTIGASFDSSGTRTNTLYATGSTNAVTCAWTNISGPNTPTITSPTSCTSTIVTGIIASTAAANYVFRLTVTDSMGAMNSMDLQVGAVPIDTNCNISSSDPNVVKTFGPLIAFGCNPWSYEDSQNYSAIHQSTTWWPTNYSLNWATPNTSGTISWPFYATGLNVGAACTTLTGAITTTSQTSITVANAGCLKGITSLPTWILVNNTSFGDIAPEMMRITACIDTGTGMGCTSGTTAATLTVGYDGRGMTGNLVGIGGYPNTVAAKTWSNGSAVGEMLIKGSGTLFSTDATQAICPAGVPGPQGNITYQVGTAALTAGNPTVVGGSGATWSNANGVFVGGFIRITATHASGTSFIFWRQIVTITDTTHLVLDHAAPTGVDGTAFSYKITSPAMYVALQFNALNGDVPLILQNGVGCESETSMFALPIHDSGTFNAVYQTGGLTYSFKTDIGNVARPNNTTAYAYYGVGPAARSFWIRSGLTESLTLANYIDEHICRDPEIADGYIGNQTLTIGGAIIGCMFDKILNASTVLTWPNLEQFGRTGIATLVPGGVPSGCSVTDTREGAYVEAWLTIAAENDPQASGMTQDFVNGLKNAIARDATCKRTVSDGYSGSEVNSFSNSFAFGPNETGNIQPITLTATSTAVTGSSLVNGIGSGSGQPGYCYGVDPITLTVTNGLNTATVASGTLSQQDLIYFYDGSMTGVFQYTGSGTTGTTVHLAGKWLGMSGTFNAMSTGGGPLVAGGQRLGGYGMILAQTAPSNGGGAIDSLANNQTLEQVWACKFVDSGHLTLFRPWDGISSSALTGMNQYYMNFINLGGFGQQPFMYGIKAVQMNLAALSSDTTTASGAQTILPLMADWFNTYGWDANNANHGTYYFVAPFCGSEADVPSGSPTFDSIHGFQGCAPAGLTNNALQTARESSIEGGAAMLQLYLANPTNTTKAIVDTFYGAIVGLATTCSAGISSTCDGTVAYNLDNSSYTQPRWVGFNFGMGGFFMNSWPAIRTMTLTQLCSVYPGSGTCIITPDGIRSGGKLRFGGKEHH